jgi:signal transduction histidine kinase
MAPAIHSSGMKKMNSTDRFRNSIFTKLLLVIITSGILVQIAVVLFFGYHFLPRIRGPLQVNLQQYCELLAQSIGSPPDTLKAKQIAQKCYLTIEYSSNRMRWKCNERLPSRSPVRRFFESEVFVVVNNSDGSTFTMSGNFQQFYGEQPWKIIPLLLGIMIILLLAYIMIRILLRPIKALDAGVKEVARGNMDYRIEIASKDELGNLSRSYNEMTQKIKEMIQARDHLLRNVSHELRSPLTRMKIALEFLIPEKRVASVSADIRTMEYLIQEILETEKLKNDYGKLKLENLDIADIVQSFAETCKNRKPGLIIVRTPKKIMVNVDEERIRMVLKNIIDNAFKYSNRSSRSVKINIDSGNGMARISISDDGIGVPSDEIPYVFEPFYRIDRSRSKIIEGYGLGLSICKTIIHAHGGNITITNNRPRGTTVIIELPLILVPE